MPLRRPRFDNDVLAKAFLELCRRHGIPQPHQEYRFHDTRMWKFDYAWPAESVALEVEGGIWTQGRHTRGLGYLKDMEKYSEAAVLGWCVIRVQPSDLCEPATFDILTRAFQRRAA